MKKSVWYNRLWQKKLSELPVDDADAAWRQMNKLLDHQSVGSNPTDAFSAKNIFTYILKLILPTLFILGGIYFLYQQKKKDTIHKTEYSKNAPKEKITVSKNTKQFGVDSVKPTTKAPSSRVNSLLNVKTNEENPKIKSSILKKDMNKESVVLKSTIDVRNISEQQLDKASLDNNVLMWTSYVKKVRDSFNFIAQVHIRENLITYHELNNEVKQKASRQSTGNGDNYISRKGKYSKKRLERDSLRQVKMMDKFPSNLKGGGIKKEKPENNSPTKTSHEFQIGMAFSSHNVRPYLGVQTYWTLRRNWSVGTGVRINFRKVSGEYFHPGYNMITLPTPIQIVDSRKLTILEIPLSINYKVSNLITLKAETNFGFLIKQNGGSRLGYVASILDTVHHSKQINMALSNSTINKFNFSLGGGVNINFQRFKVEALYYYQPTAYKITSDLGSYSRNYGLLNLGLGYRF